MKQLKGWLIDPIEKTITEVTHNGDYKQIYEIIHCDCFTVVTIDDRNILFVDDEGLLKNPRYFFRLKDYNQPLAGYGLILGTDEEGETIGSSYEYEDVQNLILGFQELSVQGFEPLPRNLKTDKSHPMGEGIPIIGHIPVFGPPEPEECKE